ncbi:MAG: B12-binding domain-containing radical SAM protein [Candidatus Schekmanbacteria bacterium]|nr:B12-binding domain-containing radical SAM protein [Candidatus Schekmanbacteria bacterium]
MPRILIGQSSFLRFDPKLYRAHQPYPPLGSLYAASFLRARGDDVAFFDAMIAASEQDWAAALDRVRPRFAVLFEDNFNYLSKMCLARMREAAFRMLAMGRARGVTNIACGADATDHADRYLDQGADYVLIGEGEQSLAELLDCLTGKTGTPPECVSGVAGRLPGSRERFRSPPRPPMHELDALPMPAWDLADMSAYREIWRANHGRFSVNVVTARGCPYHCNWCAKPIWGQRYHSRSPEHVVAELGHLADRYGADHIWFCDDIFGLKPGWIERFAELLAETGRKLPFKCLSRPDLLLRGQTVEALARAGCETVWMGAESGAQAILDAMEKGTTVEQIDAAAARLKAAGIMVGFFLQFGYPGEGWKEIDATLRMIRRCKPDDIGISVSYPLPGTPFHRAVAAQLGPKHNWEDSDDLAMLYRGPFTTTFYQQLHRYVHRSFRAHRALDVVREVARRPWRFRLRHLRLGVGMAARFAALPAAWRRLRALSRSQHPAYTGAVPAADEVR